MELTFYIESAGTLKHLTVYKNVQGFPSYLQGSVHIIQRITKKLNREKGRKREIFKGTCYPPRKPLQITWLIILH